MNTQSSLQQAIEQLYEVFSTYPLRDHVDGCPHCVFESDHALIHSAPLRALSAEDLGYYSFKAMTTWGDSDDYRHFLPRIFELHAQNIHDVVIDIDTTFSKLEYAGWQTWPVQEQEAIRKYFLGLWLVMLDTRPVDDEWFDDEASSYLNAIRFAGVDLGPYLAARAANGLA